jgi:hypothetical protein
MCADSVTGVPYFCVLARTRWGSRRLRVRLGCEARKGFVVLRSLSEEKSRSLRTRNEMTELLIAVDSSEIREGKLDAVKAGLAELAEFVEANAPE